MDRVACGVETQSVLNTSVRTNNDVEGRYRRLKRLGHAGVHVCELIEILYTDASLVPVHMQLVQES